MKNLIKFSFTSEIEENKQDLKTKLLGLKNIIKMLFSTRKMIVLTMCLMMSFLAVGMGSYGVHFAVRFSNMDIFVTSAMKETVNIVFIVILMFLLKYVSRGVT